MPLNSNCRLCKNEECEYDTDPLGRTKRVCIECVEKYKKSSKYKHFIATLFKEYGLDEDDLNCMTYIGGNESYHRDYYRTKFSEIELPDFTNVCLCGSKIKINCYLKDLRLKANPVIVVGSCCQRKYLSQIVKQCIECGIAHASKVNLTCRSCVAELKRAEALKLKSIAKQLMDEKTKPCACGKMIAIKYVKCYGCFISTP